MWIASYPRSGSAMVRAAFNCCFGIKTGSIYPEEYLSEKYRKLVGSTDRVDTWCKTHAPAMTPVREPTIVIVRDPRRVFISLQKFYRDKNKMDFSMEQIIRGEHPWNHWSDWIRTWVLNGPRNALWIHYESFDPKMIREHFNIPQTGNTMPDIEAMRATDNTMFNDAEKSGFGCLPKYRDLIREQHGAVMTMLGYEL